MNGFSNNRLVKTPPEIQTRAEAPQDESFLFTVYASTRAEELDATGWDESTRQAFLQMQFAAQRQGYRTMFPDAAFSVILVGERPAGRIVVNHAEREILLVDIALMPEFQNLGVGGVLVRTLINEAKAADKSLRVSVFKGSRAAAFYQRLGFVQTGEAGMYDLWVWRPPVSVSSPC